MGKTSNKSALFAFGSSCVAAFALTVFSTSSQAVNEVAPGKDSSAHCKLNVIAQLNVCLLGISN